MSTAPRMKTFDDAFDETLILWASHMMVSGISKDRSYCRQNRGHCDVPEVADYDFRRKKYRKCCILCAAAQDNDAAAKRKATVGRPYNESMNRCHCNLTIPHFLPLRGTCRFATKSKIWKSWSKISTAAMPHFISRISDFDSTLALAH